MKLSNYYFFYFSYEPAYFQNNALTTKSDEYFEAFTLDVAAEGIIVGSEIVILLEEFGQIHKVNGVVGLNGAMGLVQGWELDGARGVEAKEGWKKGVGWGL